MAQRQRAEQFSGLHVKGNPLILYNIWDAGSAQAVVEAGARAIATGSWSVAEAQGFRDGQALPLDFLIRIVERITATVDIPVTVDFEGGYARASGQVAENVRHLLEIGVVGINFEDQIVGGDGVYCIEEQAARIKAIRGAANEMGIPFFINARTDLFLKNRDRSAHPGLMVEALERARAYGQAGASGFFAPFLMDDGLIADLCEASPLPVNIMQYEGAPDNARLAELGVARISYGPGPYVRQMASLTAVAKAVYEG